MSLLEEAELETARAFRSNVEDLALAELQRLGEQRELLQGELVEINESIKRVKTVLRATVGSPTKQKPKRKQSEFSMSQDRESEIVQWLTGNKDEITTKMVSEQFPGWSESYANMAVKFLRETGVLRQSAVVGSQRIYRSLI